MNHLLKMLDLSSKEIDELLNLADQLKYEQKHGMIHPVLDGRTLAMIFQKPSTRTRVSFEVGMLQLGGHSIFLSAEDMQLGRGEPTEDTARVLSRYCDAIMMRTYEQSEIEELAHFGTIPVINGLSDFAHPCQVLADLMTIREFKGSLDGLKVAFIGDGNNMMNSTIVGCLKMRMNVAVACPEGYNPAPEVLDYAAQVGHFEMYRDPRGAARGADVVITDVWASMGMEDEEQQRLLDFRGFTVSAEVMRYAKPGAMVLHGLPARRGEEITAEILEEHSAEIFEEAENRLHVQKAVLVKLIAPAHA